MSPDPETAWNDQVAWLQRLARRLVRDECLADDMAQEAVLAALRAGRADAPRAWWIGVVRNLARDEARSAGRRRAREESVFRAADAPPTHEVVGEAEAQRRISDAVLALDEPYRTVLLLRYVRDLPPRAIARELDRPVGTVKVQLERGRERLRARLADEFGPGGPLALALLPLAAPGRGAVAAAAAVPASVGLPLLAGALLMKIPTLFAAVTLVLACAWGVKELVPTNDRRDAPAALERSDAELAATGAPVTSAPLIAAVGESATARVAPNEAGDSPTEAPGTPTGAAWIRGRALLVDGTPLTGIYVYAYGPVDQTVVVDEIGSFAFEGLEAGEYEVRLSWRGDQLAPEGAQNATSVRAMAPTEDIEFQLDGLLVELHLGERMEGRPIKGLTVETYGHPAIRFMSTGGAGTMGNAVLELVPAGPGYLFKGTLDDERDVVGHLAPGLRSGRYRVEMSYSAPGLGAIEGKLTGGTIEHPDRITVWIDPLAEAFDDAPPRSSPALRLRTQEPARNDGILPGKYAVRAKASDLPPFEYWVPVPRPSEIEVSEGDVTSIDVELIRGGNVMVKIDVEPTENDSNPELQRWNPSAETWERLDVMHRVGENFQWGLNISNGVEAWSADALPIGPVRLRLVGEGWETQETTLEILASEMARWHPRLQRTD